MHSRQRGQQRVWRYDLNLVDRFLDELAMFLRHSSGVCWQRWCRIPQILAQIDPWLGHRQHGRTTLTRIAFLESVSQLKTGDQSGRPVARLLLRRLSLRKERGWTRAAAGRCCRPGSGQRGFVQLLEKKVSGKGGAESHNPAAVIGIHTAAARGTLARTSGVGDRLRLRRRAAEESTIKQRSRAMICTLRPKKLKTTSNLLEPGSLTVRLHSLAFIESMIQRALPTIMEGSLGRAGRHAAHSHQWEQQMTAS